MERDTLFLLKPDFADPAYPGKRFYCWHCALMEGVLVSFPHLAARLEVRRVAFARPRAEVVALIGPENDSLPLLVLAADAPAGLTSERRGSVRYVQDKDAILEMLTRRHGFPEAHP
jgi:hypothetical protein